MTFIRNEPYVINLILIIYFSFIVSPLLIFHSNFRFQSNSQKQNTRKIIFYFLFFISCPSSNRDAIKRFFHAL